MTDFRPIEHSGVQNGVTKALVSQGLYTPSPAIQRFEQLAQGLSGQGSNSTVRTLTPDLITQNGNFIWQNMQTAINDAPLVLPASSEKALNAHRIHNEKLAEAAAKGRNIGYTIDGKQYPATRGGDIEFTENGKTVKMDANGNPVKTSVTEVPGGKAPVGKETSATGGDKTVPPVNEEAPKGTKKHKKESGFQRMEREAAENRGKGSGLKFQEGSGKGKQPGDYAGVHVDQKAHNKRQAEYDKMFADLDKADKQGRKAAVEANKGKKSGVVGAEAKAQKQRIADLEKEIEDLKKNAGKEGTNLKEYKQRFRKFKKADNINKLKKFGKWAGIATAVGVIGAAIWALCKNKKDDAVQPEETTPVVPPTTPEEETPETPVVPPVTPVVPPVTPEPEEEEDATQKEYEVKKGDNVWNIAQAQLKEELGRIPTNKEIRERTEIIIEKNGLKWEDDNYTVIIQPGDKLNIAA